MCLFNAGGLCYFLAIVVCKVVILFFKSAFFTFAMLKANSACFFC